MDNQTKVQGRYLLDEPLGEGGMAEVWRAHDERLQRPVAIKFLSPHLTGDPEFLVRFFSEAQTVAAISHPNVVRVLDFGQHDGRPYLVMECLPGGATSALVGQSLMPERAFEIVEEAARGAAAAHAVDLVHRDIKPGNILLDDSDHAKLADFGISSNSATERLTQTGTTIGSPHYISPEQVSGKTATPRSDVYSLGVVLYELLTGKKPIDADNVTAVAIAQVDRMPEPPSSVNPDLSPEIDDIVMRCLAKDPDERFATADELADTLAAYRAGVPTSSHFLTTGLATADDGDGTMSEGTRRSFVGAAVVVLLLLAAGTAVLAGGNATTPVDAEEEDAAVEKQPEVELTFSTESPSPSVSAAPETQSNKAPAPSPTPTKTKAEEPEETKEEKPKSASPTPEPSPTVEPEPTPTDGTEAEPSPTSDSGTETSPAP